MAQAVSTSVNSKSPKPVKRGRPVRAFTLEATPLTRPDGSVVTETFGEEWIHFLTGAINRYIEDGTFVVERGVISVNHRKASA